MLKEFECVKILKGEHHLYIWTINFNDDFKLSIKTLGRSHLSFYNRYAIWKNKKNDKKIMNYNKYFILFFVIIILYFKIKFK